MLIASEILFRRVTQETLIIRIIIKLYVIIILIWFKFFLPELCKQIIAGENCEKVGYRDMSIPSLLGL